eukprot:gene7735-8503_t
MRAARCAPPLRCALLLLTAAAALAALAHWLRLRHTSTQERKAAAEARRWQFVTANTTPPFSIAVYPDRDVVSAHLRREGVWDAGSSTVMLRILGALPGGPHLVVDFGANLGWFSLLARSRGHRAMAVEAMARNCAALRASARRNGFAVGPGRRLELVRAALAARGGL